MKPLRAAAVLGLLILGLSLQIHFFGAYPQPALFGDPAEYATLGHRLHRDVSRLLQGQAPRAVFASVRGMLYMTGVASVFGLLEAIRPDDLAFDRMVMAGFNTIAMLGCFALGRRLGRSFFAGLVALGLAAVYPSFAVETPRLYPDPVTGCFFAWSAVLWLDAVRKERASLMLASGLLLSAGLFVRSQILDFMFLLLSLAAVVSAPVWLRRPASRRLALAFILSLLPLGAAWTATRWLVGRSVDPLVQLGNETFKPYYPYGFWQYLDTDGWIGPYRLKNEPYAQALQAAQKSDRRLLRSFPRQILFTIGYVARRPGESLLLVLDNAYRLYDRPANDYKWDYPYPYGAQVWVQRGVCVLAAGGMALALSEEWGALGVFLMPLAVAILHGLVFSWPRYNLPAMPVVLAAAGGFLWRVLGAGGRSVRADRTVWGSAAGGVALLILGQALASPLPEAAHVLRALGALLELSVPFLLARRIAPESPRSTLVAGGLFLGLAALTSAHIARDRLWHQVETVLGPQTPGAGQEIRLSEAALDRLRRAGEAFLVMDLVVPGGDVDGLSVQVGAETLPGSRLVPTMPRLPESTTMGGRDWHGYPQWWALPLEARLLPASASEPLRVTLRSAGEGVLLKGDRFSGQERVYEGPSFGDWPHAVGLKLEYDGDYRLTLRQSLGSKETRSFVLAPDDERRSVPFAHRIRLVTLANDEGQLAAETPPLPAPPASLGFFAYSGKRGGGELVLGGRTLFRIPFGGREDLRLEEGRYRLCYRADPTRKEAYGAYVLSGPLDSVGAPARLEVRFKTGMSLEPMFFVVDRTRTPAELREDSGPCAPPGTPLVDGIGRILDASRSSYPDSNSAWIRVALGSVLENQPAVLEAPPGSFRWSVAEVF